MFQLIILGLLILFIVLHFYTDISNYMKTGNTIEGMDARADAAGAPPPATPATPPPSTPATPPAASAAPAPAAPAPAATPTLPEGVCLGVKSHQDSTCAIYTTEDTCPTTICKWSPIDPNPKVTEATARDSAQNSKKCGIPKKDGGECKKNCVKPTKWSGNCENTEYINSQGKREKKCGWDCKEDIYDNKSCQFPTHCKGCPCEDVEWTEPIKQKTFDMTGDDWREKAQEATAVSESTYGWGSDDDSTTTSATQAPDTIEFDKTIFDDKTVREVLADKNLIPSDIDLNLDDRATSFSRIGDNILNKITIVRNLDIPPIDENDKELLGRAYRQVYEIKQGSDTTAIKSIEMRFKNTLYSLLSKTSLSGSSVNWDTPTQTSAVDSTTGMFGDTKNTLFGQGDMAKNNDKKPDGGLCLWKGCESTKRKPYDSIWSLY